MSEQNEKDLMPTQKSREWENTFDAISDWICLIDRNARIVRSNKAGATLLGMSAKELIGQNCCQIVHGTDQPIPGCLIQKMLRSQQREEIEIYVPKRQQWWLVIADPLRDEHGILTGAVHIARDITERKHAEEALRYERMLAQQYLDVAGVMLIALDIHQRVTLINPKGCEILGYSEEEILGQNWFDTFLPSKNIAEVKQVFDQIVSGHIQAVESYENPIVKKDGSRRIMAWHNSVLRDNSGKIIGLFSSGEDITERKRDEREIHFQAGLLNMIGQAVISTKPDGIINYFNRAAEQLYGWPADEALGRNIIEVTIPEISQEQAIEIMERLRRGKSWSGEFLVHHRDGTVFPVMVYDEPMFDALGNLMGIVGISADITERRRAEEELQQLNQKLEQLVEARTRELQEAQEKLIRQEKLAALGQLAGSVAHELRHPLSVLSNAAYFLRMSLTDADETTNEYLDMIAAEVRKSDKIISDLLDFSRNQFTKKPFRTLTQLKKVVDEVLMEHPLPEGVELESKFKSDLPPVQIDPQQIKQVLTNLILNAYQSMPEGGRLSVGTRRSAVGSSEYSVLLTIQDTGCGIAPEHFETIFEPLFTTKPKGIGLGLAVCKNLIEANGGEIEVKSVLGDGTTFTVFLPIKRDGGAHDRGSFRKDA